LDVVLLRELKFIFLHKRDSLPKWIYIFGFRKNRGVQVYRYYILDLEKIGTPRDSKGLQGTPRDSKGLKIKKIKNV